MLIAAVGMYLLAGSHAAGPYTSNNADQGTLANGASSVQGCAGANDGNCVVFGQQVAMDGNVALGLNSPGTPFAASSFWNMLLPDNTPVNPDTAAYVTYMECNLYPSQTVVPALPLPCTQPTGIGSLNTKAYSAPLYVVPAGQPTVNVGSQCSASGAAFTNVPVPADAHPAVGSDSEIQIYQPSADKYWEYWGFQKDASGNWEACAGGVMPGTFNKAPTPPVSQNDGIFPSGGATATGLPLLGGVVRIDELQAGRINHAMGLTIGDAALAVLDPSTTPADNCPLNGNAPVNVPQEISGQKFPGVSYPAVRGDGFSTDPCAIPEGLRFRLPPASQFDLNGYAAQHPLTPVAMAIAVAAQKYGFVVYDRCGQPCLNVRLGDQTTYTNTPTPNLPDPYASGVGVGGVNNGNKGLFGGVAQGQILKNFPWDKLEALPFNYGDPASPGG